MKYAGDRGDPLVIESAAGQLFGQLGGPGHLETRDLANSVKQGPARMAMP